MRRIAPSILGAVLSSACVAGPCDGLVCGEGEICNPSDGFCHCGEVDGEVCRLGDSCRADYGACLPDGVCGPGTRWFPAARAFRDATDEWGLSALGVEGVRMSVTDIDGDGWADLEVRRGAARVEGDPTVQRTWLLRNTGSGFEDVTEVSGLLSRRQPVSGRRPVEVVAWGDVDNDGDLDVFTGAPTDDPERSGGETSEVLLNNGEGRFTLTPSSNAVRRPEAVDAPAGATFVDVDHDGWIDLWEPQHSYTGPAGQVYVQNDRLWRGNGSGSFVDVTAEMGLSTSDWSSTEALNQARAHTRAWAGNACDLNGDGYAELLVASFGRTPNHLWQARGPVGGFDNRSVESGYAYDGNSSWQDNEFARCFCSANPAADDCAGVASPVIECVESWDHDRDRELHRLGGDSGSTLCGDLDNDGDLDLMTSEIRHWWAGTGADGGEILVNDGTGTFTRPGDEATGLANVFEGSEWHEGDVTGALFDFDNDGWLDVYIGGSQYPGNRGRLYRNQASALAFTEVPPRQGIDHNRSEGIAVADFDRDGDLDVIVGHSRTRCDATLPNNCYDTGQVRFFENLIGGEDSNWIQIDLEGGEGTNRAAIGARVRVTTADRVTQTQEVDGGHGYYGTQYDRVLHFGLGAHCQAQIEIRWPDADLSTETHTLAGGHRYHIVQGEIPAAAP